MPPLYRLRNLSAPLLIAWLLMLVGYGVLFSAVLSRQVFPLDLAGVLFMLFLLSPVAILLYLPSWGYLPMLTICILVLAASGLGGYGTQHSSSPTLQILLPLLLLTLTCYAPLRRRFHAASRPGANGSQSASG